VKIKIEALAIGLLITLFSFTTPSSGEGFTTKNLDQVLMLIQSGQYSAANRRLSKVDIDSLSKKLHGIVLNLQGSLSIRLGLPLQALEYFDQAEKAGYKGSMLSFNRGRAYLAINQPKLSILEFQSYVLQNPKQPAGYEYLGKAFWLGGDLDKAKNYLEIAHKLNPDNDIPLYFLAKLAYERGQHDLSANYLVRMLSNADRTQLDKKVTDTMPTKLASKTESQPDKAANNSISGWLSLSLVLNDNVISLAKGAPVPADIDDISDQSAQINAGINWRAYDRGGQLFLLAIVSTPIATILLINSISHNMKYTAVFQNG